MRTFLCLFAALYLILATQPVHAQNLLVDGFESGGRSGPTGAGSWGMSEKTTVSTEQPRTGTYSLRFPYNGNPDPSADAFAEQRASIPQSSEIYGRMYLYIPDNYYHRRVSPNNNKLWAIYADSYRSPGFQINLSLGAGDGGNSDLQIHRYHNGREAGELHPHDNFITEADKGQWMEIIVRVKVPSGSSSADGIIQVWKNGSLVADYTTLNMFGSSGRNYIDEMYILGWSNSGFNDTTILYVDDVEISSTPLGATSPPPTDKPKVPTNALLADSFESGSRSGPTGGGSWGMSEKTTVSTEQPRTGTYSLRFPYNGNPDPSADAFAEQRASIPQSSEIYGRMYLYIPDNYYHRRVSPNNNKLWAIYADSYRSPGFQINLSLGAGDGGNSDLQIHRYHNGREAGELHPYDNFITEADKGQWMEIIVRVKVPSGSSSADGIIQVWKNGSLVADYTTLNMYGSSGRNYIDEMYILGWSNSGFNDTTILYVDDVEISSTPPDATSPPPTNKPEVPTNLRIITN